MDKCRSCAVPPAVQEGPKAAVIPEISPEALARSKEVDDMHIPIRTIMYVEVGNLPPNEVRDITASLTRTLHPGHPHFVVPLRNGKIHTEYTFARDRWLTAEEMLRKDEITQEVALGLHIPERYDKVLNIEECYLQSDLSPAILKTVREICRVWSLSVYSTKTHQGYLRHLVIRDGKRTGEVMVNLVTTSDWPEAMQNMTVLLLKQFPGITTIVNNITDRKSMVAFGDRENICHGPGFITEQLGRYSFRISANSFFQTNTLQAEKLYETAKQFAGRASTDVLYDLYSGTGTIACYLSDAAERVVGVEVVESAVNDAKRNAEANRISNCYFLLGDLKDKLTKDSSWLNEHPRPTVVLVDPPRSGMHPKVIQQIAKLSPRRIVYVSCNPSTQARDVKLLAESGYELKMVQPVDMFPHTDHIEAVVLLTRV